MVSKIIDLIICSINGDSGIDCNFSDILTHADNRKVIKLCKD